MTKDSPRTLLVTSHGDALKGYYWPAAADNHDVILYFHGRASSADASLVRAQYLAEQGALVVVAEYHGFDGNPGKARKQMILDDAQAFLAQARQMAGVDARVVLVGHSLGGAVALATAATDKHIAAVVTLSTFAQISDVVPRLLRAFIVDRWDNLAQVQALTAPLLILHGTADPFIKFHDAPKLFAASHAPHDFIALQGVNHYPPMKDIGPWLMQAMPRLMEGKLDNLPSLPKDWARQSNALQPVP